MQFNDHLSTNRMLDLRAEEEERFVQSMAPKYGVPYVNLRGYTINPEALTAIEESVARSLQITAFDLKQKNLYVAAKSPVDVSVQQELQRLAQAGYTVRLHMCSSHSLEHTWVRYKDLVKSTVEKKGVFDISSEDISRLRQQIKSKTDVVRLLTEINTINNSRRISSTLELIFAGALGLGASDIHIEPEVAGVRLRYRFDGVLHDVVDLDAYIYERLISRLKLLSGMILNSKKTAQDGRFTFEAGEEEIEIRSSVIPGAAGESIVMRILDPKVASFKMDKLSLNPYVAAAIKNELKKPNGMIVTTGPTGSGKTTSLYAFLQEVHEEGTKIITIENPVEYKVEGIVQTQTDEEYTFATGLRAILRQDPDVIMVGEIRDKEVAETALHAAQTGHLVFTTLHTNSAAASFPRLIDMGIDPRVFGTAINIILGQRLLRLLCPNCKQAYVATPAESAVIHTVLATHPYPPVVADTPTLFRAVGCPVCGGTGFKGRASITEGIIMDKAVEEAVIRDPREHIIVAAARPQKLPTMVEDGIEKVLQGLTSMAELERVVELPNVGPLTQNPSQPSAPDEGFLSHVV
ncbi:MAG TPA: GspE/PulE family protein [Candidatus Paceibacterota bacterium]